MLSNSSNRNRIAKNTLFMYLRMFITMGASIYTSRVILSSLGIIDYGVYNVVGGIVGLLSFLNGALSGATSTYLTRSIGKEDLNEASDVLSTTIYLHIALAIVIIVISEIIGIWFLNTQLNIPSDRMSAASKVFQISIFISAISIICVPYRSLIIANEHMSFYAYISIIETFSKLIIAFVVSYAWFDSLVFYAILIAFSTILVQVAYIIYDRIHFPMIRFKRRWSRELIKNITSFVSWNLFANLAIMLMMQGTNMVLNVFFGPAVNSARAICSQVQNALTQFYTNVQFAINPQITKCCVQNEISQMQKYMFTSARLSFVIMYMMCLPFLFICDSVLRVWLILPPDYTSEFIKIGLIINVIDAISNPFIVGCLATGRIKKLMLICGTMFCLVLPISYCLFYLGYPPYYAYVSQFLITIIAFFVRLFIVEEVVGIDKTVFLKNVTSRMVLIALLSYVLVYLVDTACCDMQELNRLIVIVVISCLVVISSSYIILFENEEKQMIKAFYNKITKIK